MISIKRIRGVVHGGLERLVASVSPGVIIVLAVLALVPLLAAPGLVATRAAGDSPFLLQRTHQMAAALADGHFPPRWMPDAAYGLGYPFWNYYAPLAWLAAGTFAVLGGGVVGAIKVTSLLCFVLAALGAARLARGEWGGPGLNPAAGRGAGLLAAAAYTFAPYHLVNVYSRGDALSELAAYAVFPWLLVAIRRAAGSPSSRRIAGLAVLVAALGISHNISALIFVPVALAYALRHAAPDLRRSWSSFGGGGGGGSRRGNDQHRPTRGAEPSVEATGWRSAPGLARSALRRLEWRMWPLLRMSRRPTTAIGSGFVLGTALAAWFWVPALLERDAVQLANALGGHFDYVNHFRGLDLFDFGPTFDFSAELGAPSRIGLAQLALATAGALAWFSSRRTRATLWFWAGLSVIAVVMATPISQPLWAVMPLLRYAQFPWRWLGVVALALAMLTAPLAPWMAARLRRPILGGPFALLLGSALALSGMAGLTIEALPVGEVTVADQHAFEVFSGNIGTTVRHEYLPAGVEPRPRSGPSLVSGTTAGPQVVSGRLESAVRLRTGVNWQLWQVEVSGDEPAGIAFPILWFPGWRAEIDGDDLEMTDAADGSGWIHVMIPPGAHVVELRLGRSLVRSVSEVVSLMALLALLSLMSIDRGRRPWLRLLAIVLALGACVGLARLLPDGGGHDGPRTLDWPRAPYPHSNPGGVAFGDARLIDARLDDGSGGLDEDTVPWIEAGGGLMVELEWSGLLEEKTVETALVSPVAVQPGFGAPDVRAISQEPMSDARSHELDLPEETPSGQFFVRVRVLDESRETVPAESPSGEPIGEVYLGPVLVRGRDRFRDDLPPSPVLRAEGIALHSVQAIQDGHLLEVRLLWDVDEAPLVDFKTSIRLLPPAGDDAVTDGDGNPVQVDQVPLYGMTPPTAWQAGQLVHDRRWLVLPDEIESGEAYRVEVVLYEAHGEQTVLGTGRVSAVSIEAPETQDD